MEMDGLDAAAEKLSARIRSMDPDDQFLKHLDADSFLRARGFDIGTVAGCKGALLWLDEADVEDAFWDNGKIDNAADWYIGEGRLDALRIVVAGRLKELTEML